MKKKRIFRSSATYARELMWDKVGTIKQEEKDEPFILINSDGKISPRWGKIRLDLRTYTRLVKKVYFR